MQSVTFKRIAPCESRIYHDGDFVGEVCRVPDILMQGAHYYVIHLDEDFRGPVRVHERARVREVAEQRVCSPSALMGQIEVNG